jgi:uncharacterized membrane protein YbhN (UPF0104 family)
VLRSVTNRGPIRWMLATRPRRALFAALLAILLVAVAFVLLGRAANFGHVTRAANHADRRWFPVCLLGELLAFGGYVVAYRDIARADDGPQLTLWATARVVTIGFGAFIIGSTAGGLAVDYWALREAGAKPRDSTCRVLAMNTLEFAVLSVWAALAGLAVLAGVGEGVPLAMPLGWVVIVPACIAAAIWTTQPRRRARLTRIPDEAQKPRTEQRVKHLVRIAFAEAIGGVVLVRHILARPRAYPAAILGFHVYWIGTLVIFWGSLKAFGVTIEPAALLLAFATGYVATGLPLPAGGSGGIEASLTLTLHLVGAPLAPALLAVLVYRLFSLWLPVLPALAVLPTVGRLERDLRQSPRGPGGAEPAPEQSG